MNLKEFPKPLFSVRSLILNQNFRFCLLLFLGLFPIVFRQINTADVWWHIAIGKWLLTHRGIPDLSLFYFSPIDASKLTSELRWESVGDIFLYLFYLFGGSFGLQILVIVLTITGLIFLSRLSNHENGPWMLILLIATGIATYQLQLARNSLFSILFFPFVLWLGLNKRKTPSLCEYSIIFATLVIWSFFHGSCVFGWAMALVIFGERAIGNLHPNHLLSINDQFSTLPNWSLRSRSIALCLIVFGISLSIIVIGRDSAISFILEPAYHVSKGLHPHWKTDAALDSSNPLINLKHWLNSLIWSRQFGVPWSNDYWSPFDLFMMRPIQVAFGLSILAACMIVLLRNTSPGLFVLWFIALCFGAGYVRMVGYSALVSCAVIILSLRKVEIGDYRNLCSRIGWIIYAIWIACAWTTFMKADMHELLHDDLHISAVGKIPVFEEEPFNWVKSTFPNEPTFTTIESGSFGLLQWGFEKQVFLDGFFSPHPKSVWRDYRNCLRSEDPTIFHEKYGITVAIIPAVSRPWISLFMKAYDWEPIALGVGEVVFLHKSVNFDHARPNLFSNLQKFPHLPTELKEAYLRNYSQMLERSTMIQGRFTPQSWLDISQSK
jgi:hypothetical protein